MSATLISALSSDVSLASGEAGDETYSSTSYSSETSVYLGDVQSADGGGLGAGVAADGSAFGTDTYAELAISALAAEGTYVDSVSASADVISVSQSEGGDAFASSAAVIDVYGDADVFLGITHTSTTTVADETGSTAVSEASASVVALDFSGNGSTATSSEILSADEVPVFSAETEEIVTYEAIDCGCAGDPYGDYDPIDIDGNLAVFAIDANAFGDNTFADVSVDALALEGELSLATAFVVVAVE